MVAIIHIYLRTNQKMDLVKNIVAVQERFSVNWLNKLYSIPWKIGLIVEFQKSELFGFSFMYYFD